MQAKQIFLNPKFDKNLGCYNHSSGISRKWGDWAPSTGITHKEKEGPQPCYLFQMQTEMTLFKSMSREKRIQTAMNKDDQIDSKTKGKTP
jgi:hypothetical protein